MVVSPVCLPPRVKAVATPVGALSGLCDRLRKRIQTSFTQTERDYLESVHSHIPLAVATLQCSRANEPSVTPKKGHCRRGVDMLARAQTSHIVARRPAWRAGDVVGHYVLQLLIA